MSIQESLTRLFDNYRIVVWYDKDNEFTNEYESLSLTDVNKIKVENSEFSTKYRVLYEAPDDKFLLYIPSARPENEQNWLLDVELSYACYSTDEVSQILLSLEKGTEYKNFVERHLEFFKGKIRQKSNLERIRSSFDSNPTEDALSMKMLCIAGESEVKFDLLLEKLFVEHVNGEQTRFNRIEKYNLTDYFWTKIESVYGYSSQQPTLQNFFHTLFLNAFYVDIDQDKAPRGLTFDAKHIVHQIQSNRHLFNAFVTYTDTICDEHIKSEIESYPIEQFNRLDIFKEIDRRIIRVLTEGIVRRTLNCVECQQIIQNRKSTLWYEEYKPYYNALEYAAMFFQLLSKLQYDFTSPESAFRKYVSVYYKADQLYRQFNYSFVQAEHGPDVLGTLQENIERAYLNTFVHQLNNAWHDQVVKMNQWKVEGIQSQQYFYDHCVRPKLAITNDVPLKKVFVIISDALRYEVAQELCEKIQQTNRLTAELQPQLGSLPSVTRLGMAALLPHNTLEFYQGADGKLLVKCDNLPTSDTPKREAVLNSDSPNIKGVAVDSSAILSMTSEKGREWVKSGNVFYIYQDIIDDRSHKESVADDSFKAAQETIDSLVTLVRKLVTFNANKIIITADHGYLHQKSSLQSSDTLSCRPNGDILELKRRHVIGGSLETSDSLKSFTASQLGLKGELQFQFPNSFYRLSAPGNDGRFVHGGYSLQEVVLPIITVSPKREGGNTFVSIEISSTFERIVGNILKVSLYQKEPVHNQVLGRTVCIGLYSSKAPDRVLLSERQTLVFDIKSEDIQARTMVRDFHLNSQANDFNGQDVYLIITDPNDEENIIASKSFRLNRMIMEQDF